ncbi:MAG: hypothetical protein IJV07_03655 [Alphaproteobacteria bacterium]|nr:hypothetical protein [Alphaproteobacteria bacterium]
MSPKINQFFRTLKRILKIKEKQVPENQDDLGAYPLRMQIGAIPERRYLRTARLLAVMAFLNLAALIGLAGWFAYNAVRIDVSIANRRAINLYAIDPEYKVIRSAEANETSIPALSLVMEKAIRNYITARYSINLDPQKQEKNWGPQSVVALYTEPEKLKQFNENEVGGLLASARRKGANKEVHIYSLRQTPAGLWEALIDVFDMLPRDSFDPICDCFDNSPECITCKEENGLGQQRFRVFVRAGFWGQVSLLNPMGIQVDGIYLIPQQIHPNDQFWNIPPLLKPTL